MIRTTTPGRHGVPDNTMMLARIQDEKTVEPHDRISFEFSNSTVELVHEHGYTLAHVIRDGVDEWTKPQPPGNVRALREVAHAAE